MKHKKSVGILLCAMLVGSGILAGCGNADTPNSSLSSQTSSAPTGSTIEAPSRVDTPSNAEVNKNMTLTQMGYGREKLHILFPTVAGLDVPQKVNPVNTMIQQDTLAILNKYDGSEGTFEYQVVYNDGKILALRYTAALTTKGAAYPTNVAFTTNVNLETGERISSGAPEKASEIAARLVSGKGYQVEGEEELQQAVITALKAMEEKTLTESIANADFGPDKTPTVFTSYAGEQKVTISLPVEHALGDVAHLTIDWAAPVQEPEQPVNSEGTSSSLPESTVPSKPGETSSATPAQASASAVESGVAQPSQV